MIELCLWCDEPFTADDYFYRNEYGQTFHRDCIVRSVAGSLGHQRGRCSCFGGIEEDPPGLSRREAARAAAEFFRSRTYGFPCEVDDLEGPSSDGC